MTIHKKFLMAALFLASLCAETIEDKLAFFEDNSRDRQKEEALLPKVNKNLETLRIELQERYRQVHSYLEKGAKEKEYKELLDEINLIRREIALVEARWREEQAKEISKESEVYGIWEQSEITLSQLVMEYGAHEYLYIIPPELFQLKITLHSSLMIPRESWPTLLEGILKSNGIGTKEINCYTKQLTLLKQDLSTVTAITSYKSALNALDPKARIAYIYTPAPENLRSAFQFLERIRDTKGTFLFQVGAKIAILGPQEEIKKLVNLCETVWSEEEKKITRVVTSAKFSGEEMVKLLKTYFNGLSEGAKTGPIPLKGGHDLSVCPLNREGGVILVGPKALVDQAEEIVRTTEVQMDDPFELTVSWYTCSHSNPEDLAGILEKVYSSLVRSSLEGDAAKRGEPEHQFDLPFPPPPPEMSGMPLDPYASPEVIKPAWMRSNKGPSHEERESPKQEATNHFIPYPQTGKILMMVRKDTLSKIKEVIKKLDVAKRMVEIEVILCERMLKASSQTGINLLKVGSGASGNKEMGVDYGRVKDTPVQGLLTFFLSRPKSSSLPQFDVIYNFLLAQEDIRVTSAPSVLAINQTTATIAITDQISLNMGTAPVTTNGGTIFKETFERANFGITITMVPTIHEPEMDDQDKKFFVTLDNDISFETIKGEHRSNDKPDVLKRQVKNQVRVADGETIVIGGLRTKSAEDKNEKIPFLGEVPGIGKLFGTNSLRDKWNEMFIFIKTRVVHDPKEDLIKLREEKLHRRPGDIDALLERVKIARERCDAKRFKRSWNLFFGNPCDETLNI